MKRQRKIRVTAVVGVAMLFAACQGGDEGPTKAEFIEAADEVCEKADEKLDPIIERDVEDFGDAKKLSTDAAKVGDALLKDLRALEVPEGDEEDVEAVFGGIEKQVRSIRQMGKAAEDEDADRIDEILEEGEDVSEETQKDAEDYGFEVCGIDDSEDEDSESGSSSSNDEEEEEEAALDEDEEVVEDDIAADGLPAGSLELDEVEALLDARVAFTSAGRATLAAESDPSPRDAQAYETGDGTAAFQILTYDSPGDANRAQAGVSDAAQADGFVTISITDNVIFATKANGDDTSTAEAINDVFSSDVIQR